MTRDPQPQPSDLEIQVLSLLWDNGPMTVRQVLEAVPDRKKRAYTTVLTVLQVMEKKGLVKHKTDGTRHVYEPAIEKRRVLRPLLRNMIRNVFRGNPATAMQALIDETSVSEDEMTEIRRVLDGKSGTRKKGRQ